MSYRTQAIMSRDLFLRERISACAATQDIPDVQFWAQSNQWHLAAEPGWDDAYAYAMDSGIGEPGNRGDVINDTMILSAVQARAAQLAEPGAPQA